MKYDYNVIHQDECIDNDFIEINRILERGDIVKIKGTKYIVQRAARINNNLYVTRLKVKKSDIIRDKLINTFENAIKKLKKGDNRVKYS